MLMLPRSCVGKPVPSTYVMTRTLAYALVLLALTSGGNAKCDKNIVGEIRKMHPDAAEITAVLEKLQGEYEVTSLYVGDKTNELGRHCIQIKFTNNAGKRSLEFHGFASATYPFQLKKGTLVYEGIRTDGNDETKDGMKDREEAKEDRGSSKGKTRKKKKSKKQQAGEKTVKKKKKKGAAKNQYPSKKEDIKKKGDQKEKYYEQKDVIITYYIVSRTDNVIALYTCSDIPDEPALAFIAVATKSKEKRKTDEVKKEQRRAEELLGKVGIKPLKQLPFCDEDPKRVGHQKRAALKSGHRATGVGARNGKKHTPKESTKKQKSRQTHVQNGKSELTPTKNKGA